MDLTHSGSQSDLKSMNYFSILQEKRDYPKEIESIEGLSRFNSDDFNSETFSLISSATTNTHNSTQIAISNSDANRSFVDFDPNDFPNSNDTKALDFSVTPEGVAIYEGQTKLAVSDWTRGLIHSYTASSMDLLDENIMGDVTFTSDETEEFADIDIDEQNLFIADNFHRQIQWLSPIDGTVEKSFDDLTVGDNFVFMSSILVNENDDLYLLSQDNRTLGLYDFRGNLLGNKIVEFESPTGDNSFDLIPAGAPTATFSNAVLSDMALVSDASEDYVAVHLTGMLDTSLTFTFLLQEIRLVNYMLL